MCSHGRPPHQGAGIPSIGQNHEGNRGRRSARLRQPGAVQFAIVLGLLIFAAFPQVLLGLQTFVVRDYGFFAYPLAHYQRECFWRGEVPLWNPLNNCGVPFLAQWNTMPLYLPALIYLVLPLPWSLSFFCLAHVADRPVPLLRANYAFQAVELPAGKHHLRVAYEDRAFHTGCVVSLGAILACAAIGMFGGRTKRTNESGPAWNSAASAGCREKQAFLTRAYSSRLRTTSQAVALGALPPTTSISPGLSACLRFTTCLPLP